MNNITELLQSTLQLRSKECLKTYLESCDEYCAFLVKDRNNETLLKQINALLNGNEDERHQGLSLLQTYVAQCTVRVFSENAVNWLLQCLKISLYKDAPDTCCLSLHVFKTILSMSVKFPEVAKEVAKHVVPKFLLEHVKRRLKNLVATVQVLQCIEVCMRNYGGPTGDFRNDISNIVCHLLESGCATVTIAAKCFALLPHIGSGGSQGVTHKTAWSQQQAVVIKKIHDILDDLFANINEIQAYTRPKIELASVVLNIPHHGDPSPVVRAQKLAKQFAGLAQFLQAMLLGDFAVAKTVLPSIIMGVVCRCLSVTHTMLSNRVSADSQALMSMLPLIHTSALQTLDALIHCCGRNLILYGRTICRLITQVIKSTSTEDWPYAINKPHRSQRVAALKTLSLWLTVARSSSSVEAYAEDILTLLLVDIQSEKQSVTLTLSRKGHKGKKLNKQQSASLSLSDQEYSEKLGKVLANRRLCVAALRAVQNILQVVGSTVKPELHKAVLRVVLSLVIKVTQSCNNDVPIPYSDSKCRLSLYQLLHTLCTDPHPSDAPPVQYAVHLFSAGLKDTDIQVQLFCQRSLSTIEKITHPNAPSLYFPLQPAENQLHGAARLCSDLDRPLSSIANKDGYVVLRLVQEGGHTLLEPAKNVVPENVSRLSNENVASTADYQPDAESKGIVISKPFSINSEEQEPYVETDGNYYQEEYEDDDDDDDGGSGRDGDDVDDEENLNYDDECVDENDDENEIGEEVGEEVCEEAGDEGGEEIGEELGEEEVGEDAGEDGSDLPVISLSSGSEKAMEEEEEEEEEEEMGEEEEEEDEEMDEEEEDDVEECPRGVGKHMHDEEQVVLSRLATKRQYNNIEIRPLPGEKRSLHFEERREQKRFKPSQENFVPVSQPMQILQSGQLNKNVCGKTDFVKPVSNSIPVKHENELVEPEKDSKKVNTNFAEPENALEKTRSPSVESEKAENDFVEPEKAENDSVEPEKAENDSVEPEKAENDSVEPEKTENDSVEPENGLEKTVTDSVHPKNEEECVVQDECVIEEEDKTDIVKPENDSVEPTNDSVRVESDTEKFNDDSTKLENDSGKLENDDGKLNNDSGVLENESVKPDLNMEVEEEESAAQIDEPELQLEPETKKTDEVVTTSEIDKEVPQSETNGCEQSVVEDEVRKEKQADSKIETEVELVAKDSDPSNKTEEVVEDDVCKEKQIDSKIETEVELVAKDSDASNKTEVDTVESKQPQQPNVKDTENETVTTEDVRTNNVENSQEEDKKDENSQETQCNNKENEHSSENDSNVESMSLEVCKNVNTVCKDNDDNIDEDAMVKDFVDAVESLV